jgi:hypothetical protein
MNEERFWKMIGDSRPGLPGQKRDLKESISRITEDLSYLGDNDIIEFEKTLRQTLKALHHAHIAELSVILTHKWLIHNGRVIFNCHPSDDGFLYFRCWMIMQGRKVISDCLSDPSRFLGHRVDIMETWAEALLYVTDDAYDRKHGAIHSGYIQDHMEEHYPSLNYDLNAYAMQGEPDTASLDIKYPELVATVIKLRQN